MEKPEPDHGGCTRPHLILASGSGVITCILKDASEAECAGQDGGKSLFQARKPSESRVGKQDRKGRLYKWHRWGAEKVCSDGKEHTPGVF